MEVLNTILQRNRLTELAETDADNRILYIQAPAGYGKTVFANQWMQVKKEANAFVALDEYDNTVADICGKLAGALEEMWTEGPPAKALTYIAGPDFSKAPTEFLMKAAAAIPKGSKGRLVIDDLHYITEYSLQKLLADFLLRLPQGIRICLLSRADIPSSFGGLILRNSITFIPGKQLLFNSSEIYLLYKSRKLTITEKQAEEICVYTEGWPIGINALLLMEKIPTEACAKDWLEEFLDTQIWEMWDEHLREFMIAVCIEDELTEGLCNAMTGRTDSRKLLEQLVDGGVFLSKQRGGTYHFHKLFQNFLKSKFYKKPQEYRDSQIRAAGRWYLEQNDFYHAVVKFSSIKDYEQIAECFDLLEKVARSEFDTEQVMRAVRSMLDTEIPKRYPFLYFMLAFTARNEGRLEKFIEYADQYYKNYPQIVERNPELSHNIFFLYAMDYRVSLTDIAKWAAKAQICCEFQGVRGSATLCFPFYHKAYRDFSELLPGDINERVGELEKTLGPLLGEESGMLTACASGGLYYEMGDLQRAQEHALLAVSKMQKQFAPESKFCVLSLLLEVVRALGQSEQENVIHKNIEKMIEEDGAFYLQSNFDALICSGRLERGEADVAKEWLESRGTDVYGELDFFGLYRHFTTARAYMALKEFNHAIILLEKILEMCTVLKRRTDVMEAKILLAVSFWNKKRRNREKALAYLTEAIAEAQRLGYEQVFVNEGGELKNMLSTLKNWSMRGDYDGVLLDEFVRRLYIKVAEKAESGGGLCRQESREGVQFTQKQKRVAELMCKGYSYRKIAEEMGIQFSTVRSHIELIYNKLDVSTMDEAILKMRRLHIVDED
ncbi:LuxR C-terminal-related transcriptional regulator [Bariatricus massiliensis]|uniref:LuxR C-terminal-related transcriptional regulator n=1 Tax=Bariatricus massiliensis TaxID=1745713 RepID=A0ABS8DKX2_9FIRM|nr:LuxR C-terminal-related transcriptional regulator [Bariatricus massiliensis]MCB7305911.1 LuxR C-terminal-related transcriptional regulator [Bariatricus massiliensis]MCB7376499.1 LuxR C-terminal-related transcriptional regulator [Bariatricus massiliensis]MCB7389054.1 LuxR C-terminal-related transcriptional regulator [Bariatricus massiliensis]MCB7413227.1 LuxR C-terminal-related transcriptional regulator [Bariatricus massiliensis]MCQ5255123.1 LuxR C-terminal-related transcriptional regulator 